MGRIINLFRDRHHEVQELLPWYVTGRLDEAERAAVDAHLEGCAMCRGELAFDERLHGAVGGASPEVEQSWAAMVQRIEDRGAVRRTAPRHRAGWSGLKAGAWRMRAPALGWALAAQAGLLVLTGGLLIRYAPTPAYHALGAPQEKPAGDLLVVFQPTATEAAIRELLRTSGARMVDGPTAADAYVLQTPAGRRPAALQTLKASGQVVLAEPIDAPPAR